ncbi:MAG: alanine--tRNA ligase-related protein [archaeon]
MNRKELINSYIEFFKSKNHKQIENASLIPKEDPTVLFTTAGMHPLVPFLLGENHPQGKRLVNVQKCIRTNDIEDVGDEFHHTFFEMLGNWSLGDYWKEQAIKMTLEFYTKILKIPIKDLTITCFKGDKDAPKDTESEKIWKNLGIEKIKFLGKKDNWWEPAGNTGPCGPDTEIFVKGSEIGNNVLMQYNKDAKGNYNEAKQKNIDFGGGVERTLAILNNQNDNYLTEIWKPLIKEIEHMSGKSYNKNKRTIRIIADHIKASVFIIAEGITPSNKEHGYVLRRLLRRTLLNFRKLGIKENVINPVADKVFEIYPDYKHLHTQKDNIYKVIKQEEEKFDKTLDKGLNIFNKITKKNKKISGKDAFLLFQSYGFPIEMTQELAKEKKIKINLKKFEKEQRQHQKLSQTASAGKFKSGLADHSGKTTKLHTATHLLLTSLRKVLNDASIIQKGSNITPERLRFDFSFPRKITQEELKKVEDLVNKQIKKDHKITKKNMYLEQALKQGALGTFEEKYGKLISVYSIGNFSKEICSGPHVSNTKAIGKFKIIKESSSAAGTRRIKAVLV